MFGRKPTLTREQADALVQEHGSIRGAARESEFSYGAIHRALQREEENPRSPEEIEEDNDSLRQQVTDLKSVNRRLQQEVVKYKNKTEELIEVTIDACRDAVLSYGPIGPTVRPALDRRVHASEVALWHMTDWQGAKKTTSYNSQIMVERVLNFCRKAELITSIQRLDHPVRKAVLAFGGDMIEGLFQFPTQAFEIDATIFEQIVNVSSLLVKVVQYALSVYEEVDVVAEWGNHGRIGSKRDNVPRYDNFDRICYEMARQLLAGEPRLNWQDCPEDIQRIEIGNYRALSIHGDEVGRGGIVSDNQMMNHVNRWKAGSYKWDFRDVYIGHYHQHKESPMANGEGAIYYTGSTESDNRYALVGMAASATPTQRLHFIDTKRGRVSAQYKVYVDSEEDIEA